MVLPDKVFVMDEKIAELEDQLRATAERLAALKAEHNAKQPISRLPIELLCRIFAECKQLSGPENLEWIQLTHVCRHWRAAGSDFAELWTTLGECDMNPRLLELFYERSRSAPLTLFIRGERNNSSSVFLDALQQAHRLQEVSIMSPDGIVLNKQLALLSKPAPLIRRLALAYEFHHETFVHSSKIILENLFAGHAPRLHTLSMRNLILPWNSPIYHEGLTTLLISLPNTAAFQVPPEDVVSALRCTPRLVSLDIMFYKNVGLTDDFTRWSEPPVVLPNLLHFHLLSRVRVWSSVLPCLSVPSTCTIKLEDPMFQDPPSDEISHFLIAFPIFWSRLLHPDVALPYDTLILERTRWRRYNLLHLFHSSTPSGSSEDPEPDFCDTPGPTSRILSAPPSTYEITRGLSLLAPSFHDTTELPSQILRIHTLSDVTQLKMDFTFSSREDMKVFMDKLRPRLERITLRGEVVNQFIDFVLRYHDNQQRQQQRHPAPAQQLQTNDNYGSSRVVVPASGPLHNPSFFSHSTSTSTSNPSTSRARRSSLSPLDEHTPGTSDDYPSELGESGPSASSNRINPTHAFNSLAFPRLKALSLARVALVVPPCNPGNGHSEHPDVRFELLLQALTHLVGVVVTGGQSSLKAPPSGTMIHRQQEEEGVGGSEPEPGLEFVEFDESCWGLDVYAIDKLKRIPSTHGDRARRLEVEWDEEGSQERLQTCSNERCPRCFRLLEASEDARVLSMLRRARSDASLGNAAVGQ